jgi:NADPH:quinone reductase
MQAIQVTEPGGPEAMQIAEVPDPTPGPGEVVVRVAAAGVNFIDTYHRSGAYELPLPAGIGLEGAGEVVAVGDGVDGVGTGSRVAWAMAMGSYAEQVVVPADALVDVPDDVDLQVAAAVMLQGMTAHYLATSTVPLDDRHTVLIHAAAGGTGQQLVQWAKRRGATVIATTSAEDKAELVRSLGADEVIRYDEVDFVDAITDLGQTIDVVYDGVGRSTFDRGLSVLRPRGTMVLFGQASGPVREMDPQVLNANGSLYLTRPSLGHYIATPDELRWRAGEVLSGVQDGWLQVRIDRTYPLARAEDAHTFLEGGLTRGKLLLLPSS